MYVLTATIRTIAYLILGVAFLSAASTTSAQDNDLPAATGVAAASLDDVMKMLEKQQAELDAQKAQIEKQNELISTLQDQQNKIAKQEEQIAAQTEQIEKQKNSIQAMQAQLDQIAAVDPTKLSEEQIELREQLDSVQQSIQTSEESASTTYDITSFPNSIPIPGTAAAIRIGGYVKMNIVESFSPIGSGDRFIVGTIPVPQESTSASAAITVDQSRLNFDLREQTSVGPLRAFIEGDFAGDNTSFRLRHAFGQYKAILAGQTWSTFMDAEASPEELDFEGINGRLNVRQAMIRAFPEFAQDWNLLLALENPNAEVTGGDGLSQWPDFVASIRRTWFDLFHAKTALILRNIEATWDGSPDQNNLVEDSVKGWGLSVSGKTAIPWWDDRDNFLFQFNYGEGYGRYVNDLGTLCDSDIDECFDAVFDPNGNLKALPVFAFYLAAQKWWADNMRSTFVWSYVDVDNYDFVTTDESGGFVYGPDFYAKTHRITGNIIWSPTARIDIGTEVLWGKRRNRDDQNADAWQLQVSAKYRY